MQKPIIAPSILSADLARLGKEVEDVIKAGADWIHFDVMDNHYVPNLTFGPQLCKALRNYGIQAPIDVHLMTKPVDQLITLFAKAGATTITFHPEASEHVDRSLQLIKDNGCKAGLALNPATSLHVIEHVMEHLDMLLLMSVNPGFGGQNFLQSSLKKIKAARKIIDDNNSPMRLEVDGGINSDTITEVVKAGADTFVCGSAIFGVQDYKKIIQELHHKIDLALKK